MIAVLDLSAELGKLTMLNGRTPNSTAEELDEAVGRLAPYGDGAIFISRFRGTGAWERHPKGDEIVQILEGETILRLMTSEGLRSLRLKAGMMTIVPQSMWHQFESADGVSVMTATPQPTDHIRADVADPRTLGAEGVT